MKFLYFSNAIIIEEYEEHRDVWLAIKLPRCYLKTLSEVIFLVQFDCVIVDQISKVLRQL